MTISYPTPLYATYPIQQYFYNPSQYFISNITLGIVTVVTTTENVNYFIGQVVRLIIPPANGCRQLNGKQGVVISIPTANQVEISINSSVNVDVFVTSLESNQPQILAIGDINSGQTNLTPSNQNVSIPGAFINVSP